MEVQGLFVGLSSAELATQKALWLDCLTQISKNQAYNMAGRQLTRANLAEAAKMLREVTYAQQLAAGTLVRTTYSDMSHG